MTPTPGETLRLCRTRLGLKIADVSASTGISVGTVYNIEHARCVPSVGAIAALCRLYGLDGPAIAEITSAYADKAGGT